MANKATATFKTPDLVSRRLKYAVNSAASCKTNQVVKMGPPRVAVLASLVGEIAIGRVASGTPPNGSEKRMTSARQWAIGREIEVEPILFATIAAEPCKVENKSTTMMYPGAVSHHIHIIPRLSQVIANKAPRANCSRFFSVKLQSAKNIATPIIASGHHPHGGKLKPTSAPDKTAVRSRARAERLK
jgi:hypothetical protein